MKKAFVIITTALLAMACKPSTVPYNSNSGNDGTRDTATQLLLNHPVVSNCNAEEGDNEDWYYVIVEEPGTLKGSFYFDENQKMEGNVYFRDGFGRSLQSLHLGGQENIIEFDAFEAQKGKYFYNTACTKGASAYTVKAVWEAPKVEPVVVEEPPAESGSKQPKTRPRTTKTQTVESDSIPADASVVTGTIVLVTPGDDGICRITIRGVGSKNGVTKKTSGRIKGLERKVNLYSCERNKCQGTVKATPEDLATYGEVEFFVTK